MTVPAASTTTQEATGRALPVPDSDSGSSAVELTQQRHWPAAADKSDNANASARSVAAGAGGGGGAGARHSSAIQSRGGLTVTARPFGQHAHSPSDVSAWNTDDEIKLEAQIAMMLTAAR